MCKQGGGVLVGYLGQEGRVEGLKNEGCLGGASLGGGCEPALGTGDGFCRAPSHRDLCWTEISDKLALSCNTTALYVADEWGLNSAWRASRKRSTNSPCLLILLR